MANREGSSAPADHPVLAVHKIFIWTPNGIYQNVAFPNPIHGHFTKRENLLGACITDVLSRANARRLHQTLAQVLSGHEPQTVTLYFQRQRRRYQAIIRCVRTEQDTIMGLVHDVPLTPSFPSAQAIGTIPTVQAWSHERVALLTLKELMIFSAMGLFPSRDRRGQMTLYVRTGLNNEAIGLELGCSERTVKYHVTNIYRKLQITSQHSHPSSSHSP